VDRANVAASGTVNGSIMARVAGAPISWGICEVPGWGMQLPVGRVLGEMHELGLTATELGAIGWLPTDAGALRDVLAAHDVRVVGAFVPLTCHDPDRRDVTLASAEEMASLLGDIGADNFVTAVVNDPDDWSRPELSDSQWSHLFSMLDEIEGITAAHGVRQVVHPHADTLIQTADEVHRLLESSSSAICLDTGHLAVGGADPVDIADGYAARVGVVHLKDVRLAVADRYTSGELPWMAAVQAGLFPNLGEGDVPIAETITSLERQGYGGLYVLEQDVALTDGEPPPGEGPVRGVAKSVAFLRSLDASLGATVRPGQGAW
jgi:inosose dehydratase